MIVFNDEQFLKALFSRVLTDEGRSMLSNDMHPSKALSLIALTDKGIIIFFKDVQPLNAFLSITPIVSGIVISVKEEQFPNEEGGNKCKIEGNLLRDVHPLKIDLLIRLADEGISIFVNEVHL